MWECGLDVDFELEETALEGIRKIPIMDHLTWVMQMAYRNDGRFFRILRRFAAYIEQRYVTTICCKVPFCLIVG